MREFLMWLTGGRPMKPIEKRFTDVVTGRDVWLYEDAFGRRWLAFEPWSWFRIPPLY
jgi:hypothetical protein